MTRFIAIRLAGMAFTMLAVSFLVFLVLEYNSESVAIKVLGAFSTENQRDLWLQANGYLDPFLTRYLRWLGNVMTGDFGWSTRFKAPVSDVLWPRLGYTAVLGLCAFALFVPIGLIAGMMAGIREGSKTDRAISLVCVITTSIPEFAWAVFLSIIFVFWLRLLPGTSGMHGGLQFIQLVLPVAVLVLFDFGYIARLMRASMAEVMASQYIRTAKLKGLSNNRVVFRHAMRNAMIAPFTAVILQINWLLSGVIVVEVAFGFPGFGSLLLDAALNQDIYVVEASALVSVFVAVTTQVLGDVGYMLLNPRIRIA